jgi:peroxiredoxin
MELRSVETSRLARNGLSAGTSAPRFCLPTIFGEQIEGPSIAAGKLLLLVFSDPDCGPCEALAPFLERLCRTTRDLNVLMISRGSIDQNRAKLRTYRPSFQIGIQSGWQVSRAYAMFATPIAYLIDDTGMIITDVMVGVDSIRDMGERICMREHAEKRLTELRTEFERGQAELDNLERRRKYLQEGLLRISGAIDALDELISHAALDAATDTRESEVGGIHGNTLDPSQPSSDGILSHVGTGGQ